MYFFDFFEFLKFLDFGFCWLYNESYAYTNLKNDDIVKPSYENTKYYDIFEYTACQTILFAIFNKIQNPKISEIQNNQNNQKKPKIQLFPNFKNLKNLKNIICWRSHKPENSNIY